MDQIDSVQARGAARYEERRGANPDASSSVATEGEQEARSDPPVDPELDV